MFSVAMNEVYVGDSALKATSRRRSNVQDIAPWSLPEGAVSGAGVAPAQSSLARRDRTNLRN